MALRYYTACIERADDGGYGVFFPDLPGCTSAGGTVQDAAEQAVEALALHIEGMTEDRLDIPLPSSPDAPLPAWLDDVPGEIVARILVPVEMPGRAIRANVTIDEGLLSRLDTAAALEGTSRSGLIALAVRAWLTTPRLSAPEGLAKRRSRTSAHTR